MIPRLLPQGNTEIHAPQWLVSVGDIQEFRLALEFPIDILDLKDPSRGALAPVSFETMQLAVKELRGNQATREFGGDGTVPQLSLALGELTESTETAAHLPSGFDYAKAGPSGLRHPDELIAHWQTTRSLLPEGTELVAVAYADHQCADCLPPLEILSVAIRCGFRRVLIDTFGKASGSTPDLLSHETLELFARRMRDHEMWWALAGSTSLEIAKQLTNGEAGKRMAPSCFAMRGDVCESGRSSRLSRRKLGLWKSWLQTQRNSMESNVG